MEGYRYAMAPDDMNFRPQDCAQKLCGVVGLHF